MKAEVLAWTGLTSCSLQLVGMYLAANKRWSGFTWSLAAAIVMTVGNVAALVIP